MVLSSRVLRLPLAFQEQWTHAAIQKYMRSVRPEGPYLPSNVDFVAANNGLSSAQQVLQAQMICTAGIKQFQHKLVCLSLALWHSKVHALCAARGALPALKCRLCGCQQRPEQR